MYAFKIFYQYFKRDKGKKILYFIQIFISIIVTLVFVGMLMNIKYKFDEISEITNINNIKGNININKTFSENKSIEEVNTMLKQFDSDMEKANIFEYSRFMLTNNNIAHNNLYVDYNLNKNIHFSVSEGREFEIEDFNLNPNKNIIPILISENLSHIYPLNSEFKYKDSIFTNEDNYQDGGATFKVIGVLGDECKFWIEDTILLDTLNYFDIIIIPIDFSKIENIETQYFISMNSELNYNHYSDFKEQIEDEYKDIDLVDSDLKTLFNEKLKGKIVELIFIGVFTIVLLVLSLFGFIAINQSSLISRRKEIGIHYSLGATPFSIVKIITLEIWTMCFVAMFISYALIIKFSDYIQMNYEILLNREVFEISIIIIVIYILIATIIPAVKIMKEKPIELIRN